MLIAVLSLVIGILAAIGFMLLVILGLLAYSIFFVTTSAIVIERAGIGANGIALIIEAFSQQLWWDQHPPADSPFASL